MEVYGLPEKELEMIIIKMLSVLRKTHFGQIKGGKMKKCGAIDLLRSTGLHERYSLMGKVWEGEMPGVGGGRLQRRLILEGRYQGQEVKC